jgi:hypothetical protein
MKMSFYGILGIKFFAISIFIPKLNVVHKNYMMFT